jgi:signal transduction histidine kinase
VHFTLRLLVGSIGRGSSFFLIAATLFFTICNHSFSQTHAIDSLRSLSKASKGAEKVDALNKLAFELFPYGESTVEILQEALNLSKLIKYEKGEAESLIYLAASEFAGGKNAFAIEHLKRSILISVKIGDAGLKGYGLVQLGNVYQSQDQWDSAYYFFNQSYQTLRDSLHPYYLSRVYNSLANYYKYKNDGAQELRYLKKCLAIRKALNDQSLAWIYISIAQYYCDHNELKAARINLDECRMLLGADTVNNERASAMDVQSALLYFKEGDYPKALNLFFSAKRFYQKNDFKRELANLLLNIGLAFDNMGNYETSLKNYFEAMLIVKENKYRFEQTKLEHSIAWAYFRLRQHKIAEQYAQQAVTSATTYKHQAELATALNLLGLIMETNGKYDQAFDYLNQALRLRQNIGDQLRVAATIYNIGSVYELSGDMENAVKFQLKSLQLEEVNNNLQGMAYSYQRCGSLYTKLHNYSKAGVYLDKAERISKKIKAKFILVLVYQAKRDLLIAESKSTQALTYARLYDAMKDSVFNENLSSRIGSLENLFQIEEREHQIELLNQQQKLQAEKLAIQNSQLRQQRIMILASVGGLLLVCVIAIIVFGFYKKVKSLNQEISEKNEEIQAQAEELTESNQTILRINENLEDRIEQRTTELKQAYKELDIFFYRSSHDFRRPLTTFMGLSEVAKVTVKDRTALELFEKVNETARSLDKMLYKLQSISDVGAQGLIYKEVFMKDVFEFSLNNFKDEIAAKQIQATITVKSNLSFFSYAALIQIIVANLIENAIAFSVNSSAEIRVSAFEANEEIVIEVQDNGQGIEPEYIERVFEMYFRGNEKSKGNGLGLYIVKKTVQKLNGRVELTSVYTKGTTVKLFLPNRLPSA